jgi:hypothetical protein
MDLDEIKARLIAQTIKVRDLQRRYYGGERSCLGQAKAEERTLDRIITEYVAAGGNAAGAQTFLF